MSGTCEFLGYLLCVRLTCHNAAHKYDAVMCDRLDTIEDIK